MVNASLANNQRQARGAGECEKGKNHWRMPGRGLPELSGVSAQSPGNPHKRLKACHKLFSQPNTHTHRGQSSVCLCVFGRVCVRTNKCMNE